MSSMSPQALVEMIQGSALKDADFAVTMSKVVRAKDHCDPMFHEFFNEYYDETERFLQSLTQYLQEFRTQSASPKTYEESHRLTHTIKGASATLGFNSIAVVAEGLEHFFSLARAGKATVDENAISLIDPSLKFIHSRLEELKLELGTVA